MELEYLFENSWNDIRRFMDVFSIFVHNSTAIVRNYKTSKILLIKAWKWELYICPNLNNYKALKRKVGGLHAQHERNRSSRVHLKKTKIYYLLSTKKRIGNYKLSSLIHLGTQFGSKIFFFLYGAHFSKGIGNNFCSR